MKHYQSHQDLTDDWYEFWGYPYNQLISYRYKLEDKYRHKLVNLKEITSLVDVSESTIPLLISESELNQIRKFIPFDIPLFDRFDKLSIGIRQIYKSHGIVRSHILPRPPYDIHWRIDLLNKTTKNHITTTESLGRIRIAKTIHRYYEIHSKVLPLAYNTGAGILLYAAAAFFARHSKIVLRSTVNPSVMAHRLYMSKRLSKLCVVDIDTDRYKIFIRNLVYNNIVNILEETPQAKTTILMVTKSQ